MFATALYYYEREERMNTQGVSLASIAQVNAEKQSKKSSDTSYRG